MAKSSVHHEIVPHKRNCKNVKTIFSRKLAGNVTHPIFRHFASQPETSARDIHYPDNCGADKREQQPSVHEIRLDRHTRMVAAWYMSVEESDSTLPHKQNPHVEVSLEELEDVGVLYFNVSGPESEEFKKICEDRGYNYQVHWVTVENE